MGWLFQHFPHQDQDILSEGCRLRLQRGFGRSSGSCGREGGLSPLERSSSGHCDTGVWGGVFAFQGVREHLGLEPRSQELNSNTGETAPAFLSSNPALENLVMSAGDIPSEGHQAVPDLLHLLLV